MPHFVPQPRFAASPAAAHPMAPPTVAPAVSSTRTRNPLPDAWRVEVFRAATRDDPEGESVLAAIRELGIEGVECVRSGRGFLLSPELAPAVLERAAREFLADPLLDVARICAPRASPPPAAPRWSRILVMRKPGVMDPVALTVQRALVRTGIVPHSAAAGFRVATFRVFELCGALAPATLAAIGARVLGNETIDEVLVGDEGLHFTAPSASARHGRVEVPLCAADDARLAALSPRGRALAQPARDAGHPGALPRLEARALGLRAGDDRADLERALQAQDLRRHRRDRRRAHRQPAQADDQGRDARARQALVRQRLPRQRRHHRVRRGLRRLLQGRDAQPPERHRSLRRRRHRRRRRDPRHPRRGPGRAPDRQHRCLLRRAAGPAARNSCPRAACIRGASCAASSPACATTATAWASRPSTAASGSTSATSATRWSSAARSA